VDPRYDSAASLPWLTLAVRENRSGVHASGRAIGLSWTRKVWGGAGVVDLEWIDPSSWSCWFTAIRMVPRKLTSVWLVRDIEGIQLAWEQGEFKFDWFEMV